MKDPGFEFHTVRVPSGPNGMTIPGDSFGASVSPGSLYWDTVNISNRFYYNVNGWAVFSNNIGHTPTGSGLPEISTANPRSGTYHWRVPYLTGEIGGAVTYPLPIGGSFCTLKSGLTQGYSARCEPGDLALFSGYYTVSDTTDGPFPLNTALAWYDSDATRISTVTGPVNNLTTSYVKHEHSAVAPAGTYAVVFEFDIENGFEETVGTVNFDADDFVLGIT